MALSGGEAQLCRDQSPPRLGPGGRGRALRAHPSIWKGLAFIYLFIFGCIGSLLLCTRAFSSCGERGVLFVVVHGLLIAVASLITEHGL